MSGTASPEPKRTSLRAAAAAALAALLAVALLAAGWALLGPVALGGRVTPLVVHGSSMQPAIDSGDLILLRRQRAYEVGDVVAHRDPELGIVIHRIVDEHDQRYITRGDNRSRADHYRPSADDIVGRLWLRIPGRAGTALALGSQRSILLLLLAGLAVAFASSGPPLTRKRRTARGRSPTAEVLSRYSPVGLQLALLGTVLIAVGGVIASLPAWRGNTEISLATAGYQLDTTLSYGGPVTLRGVYDDDLLAPPSPVFRSATTRLPITYRSQLLTTEPDLQIDAILGAHRIVAVVANANTWSRTIELASEPFAAATAETTTTIDLPTVDRLIADFEAATGVAGGRYSLTVTASSELTARVAGQPRQHVAEQQLHFRVEPDGLTLEEPRSTLDATLAGSVPQPTEVDRTAALPLLGDIALADLPPIGWAGVALGLTALLTVTLATVRTAQRAPGGPIRARLGRLLARAERAPRLPLRIVEVAAIDDLAAVAEQRGHMVLELDAAGALAYVVLDGDTAYRYTPDA